MPSAVTDNTAQHRFEMEVQGHRAVAVYARKPGVVTILHTEVPPELGGKGVGSALIKGALDLIRAKGERVVPRCAFTAAYIEKHPEYRDLVAPEDGR